MDEHVRSGRQTSIIRTDLFTGIVGSSGPMRQLYQAMARVAGAKTTVLIRGESGTGKELIAQASTLTRHGRRSR